MNKIWPPELKKDIHVTNYISVTSIVWEREVAGTDYSFSLKSIGHLVRASAQNYRTR